MSLESLQVEKLRVGHESSGWMLGLFWKKTAQHGRRLVVVVLSFFDRLLASIPGPLLGACSLIFLISLIFVLKLDVGD